MFDSLINESIDGSIAVISTVREQIPLINAISNKMIATLGSGNKILCCGNGGSAADSAHFAAELLNRFETERQPLPGLALSNDASTITAIGNDYDFKEIYSKQILALGQQGDMLLAFTTSGNSSNILQAVNAAKQKGMTSVVLTGITGGEVAAFLQSDDFIFKVQSKSTARIQEAHGLLIHLFCQIIDHHYAGIKTNEQEMATDSTAY